MSDVLILMSTYNGQKFLEEQLLSIVNQQKYSVDIYIRDDGSTDRTLEIIHNFMKIYNNIYLLESNKNLGPAKSFLLLLKNVEKYSYYAFADQDDIWDLDKVEKAIDAIKGFKKPALYCSNARLINYEGQDMGRFAYKKKNKTVSFHAILCSGNILGCTMVFNNRLAELIKSRDMPQRIIMHDYYIAAVCLSMNGVIKYDNNARISYRQHMNNSIGIPTSKSQAIKQRVNYILKKEKISIADQAFEILNKYDIDNLQKKNFLTLIMNYKNGIIERCKLAFSLKTHYDSLNFSITIRLALLLGRR